MIRVLSIQWHFLSALLTSLYRRVSSILISIVTVFGQVPGCAEPERNRGVCAQAKPNNGEIERTTLSFSLSLSVSTNRKRKNHEHHQDETQKREQSRQLTQIGSSFSLSLSRSPFQCYCRKALLIFSLSKADRYQNNNNNNSNRNIEYWLTLTYVVNYSKAHLLTCDLFLFFMTSLPI